MATAPNTPNPLDSRRSLRRARTMGGSGGFGGGVSTTSRSIRDTSDDHVPDHPDDDEPDLLEAGHEMVARRSAALPPPPAIGDAGDDEAGGAARMLRDAALAGDPGYAREMRQGIIHRLLMRGISLQNIASQLQLSVSTVQRDIRELKARLRVAAQQININELIGTQQALYDEVQAMSLRISSGSNTPIAMKLAGMRTALAANADRTRFLTNAGVFDVLQFRRAEDGSEVSDIHTLMDRTEELLARLTTGDDLPGADGTPPTPPTRRRRRVQPGGFSEMTFDDAGASSSDNEVQHL